MLPTIEVLIYVCPEMTGQELGVGLLENLLDAERKARLHPVPAIITTITTEFQSSLKLHANTGFHMTLISCICYESPLAEAPSCMKTVFRC
jgi:L-amino acid N-acyltransferase YncA